MELIINIHKVKGVKMARNFIKKAVVKLDPPETKSTGGMVVEIISQAAATVSDFSTPKKYVNNSEYLLVRCDDNCQIGWIYTDKTNYLKSPN